VAYDEALAARVRERLRGNADVTAEVTADVTADVTEQTMFGGLTFLTGGTMTVGVYGADLLVRVGPDAMDATLARPGVRPFVMRGRATRGFVLVAADTLDDRTLDGWLAEAGA
jgi:TfoX/Sxy family transcriptional regulator of competence genes